MDRAAGASTAVEMPLRAADLAYWDSARHAWTLEPGTVELLVGTSSADRDLTQRATLLVQP